jgi:hypothetical protein
VSVYVCECMCECVYMSVSVWVSVSVCVCVWVWVCVCEWVYVWDRVSEWVNLCVCVCDWAWVCIKAATILIYLRFNNFIVRVTWLLSNLHFCKSDFRHKPFFNWPHYLFPHPVSARNAWVHNIKITFPNILWHSTWKQQITRKRCQTFTLK